ncbi:MAG: hypothetical protein KJ970_13160 [Candidatus Eisenbacteria bacterium]|uniref:Uncharacterized protein n=1 Tax=Eiseniibacteriota bacterium TaxID=2212470 RepID=A0A948RVM7_UNCEI|nr:hypothetical protein [Candidatus Eisenbacteria bacterium]
MFLQQYDHNGDYLTGSDIGLRIYKYADNALSWTFDRVEIANCAFNIAAKSLRLCGVISSQSGAGSNYFAMDNFGLGFGKDEFLPTDPYELDEYPGSKDFDAGYNQEAFLDSAIDGEPIEYNLSGGIQRASASWHFDDQDGEFYRRMLLLWQINKGSPTHSDKVPSGSGYLGGRCWPLLITHEREYFKQVWYATMLGKTFPMKPQTFGWVPDPPRFHGTFYFVERLR